MMQDSRWRTADESAKFDSASAGPASNESVSGGSRWQAGSADGRPAATLDKGPRVRAIDREGLPVPIEPALMAKRRQDAEASQHGASGGH